MIQNESGFDTSQRRESASANQVNSLPPETGNRQR